MGHGVKTEVPWLFVTVPVDKREDTSVAAIGSHEQAAQWIAFMQGFRVHRALRSMKEHEAELVD